MNLSERTAGLLAALAVLLSATLASAQPAPTSLHDLPLQNLEAFRPAAANWRVAGGVRADRDREGHLEAAPGTGVLVNLPGEEHQDDLFTTWEHADLELELDVMMPRGSNSGLYFQGRYEVQLFDSWGEAHPGFADVGGIYQRWDEARPDGQEGYGGVAPRVNAARAPGLWQHLRVRFVAPRFDAQGRKVANARFDEVTLNGVVLHEGVEVTGPTRAAAFDDEQPAGPLMIQGDHGPVAFRNIRYKRFGEARVRLSDVRYRFYPGAFESRPDVARMQPAREGAVDGFRHDVAGGDTFAVVFEGRLHAPTAGPYRFTLDLGWVSDDPHFTFEPMGSSELRVGDQVVWSQDRASRRAEGTVALEAGAHPFRLFYHKNFGERSTLARLGVEGPDTPVHALNAPGSLPQRTPPPQIAVGVGQEPYLLRHMVRHGDGLRTHAISVGDPAGVHYAMDLDRAALLHVWRGPFVDATPMWHSRGTDQVALPLGSVVALDGTMPLARLSEADAAWPAASDAAGYQLEGYTLDADGRPVFAYRLGGLALTDRLVPDAGGLTRTLTVEGTPDAGGYWVRLAAGSRIEPLEDGTYGVDGMAYYLTLREAGGDAVIRTSGGRQELLVPVSFDGGTARVVYSLVW